MIIAMLNNIKPNRNALQSIVFVATYDAAVQAYEIATDFIRKSGLILSVGLISKTKSHYDFSGCHAIIGTSAEIIATLNEEKPHMDSMKELFFDDGDLILTQSKLVQFLSKILDSTRSCRLISLSSSIKRQFADGFRKYGPVIDIRFPVNQTINKNVDHVFIETEDMSVKLSVIAEVLFNIRNNIEMQAIIFCQDKLQAMEISDHFNVSLHSGQMTLDERRDTLRRFSIGEIQTICTTNVLSRAINGKNVVAVINMSAASSTDRIYGSQVDISLYINRTGRCGRFGMYSCLY